MDPPGFLQTHPARAGLEPERRRHDRPDAVGGQQRDGQVLGMGRGRGGHRHPVAGRAVGLPPAPERRDGDGSGRLDTGRPLLVAGEDEVEAGGRLGLLDDPARAGEEDATAVSGRERREVRSRRQPAQVTVDVREGDLAGQAVGVGAAAEVEVQLPAARGQRRAAAVRQRQRGLEADLAAVAVLDELEADADLGRRRLLVPLAAAGQPQGGRNQQAGDPARRGSSASQGPPILPQGSARPAAGSGYRSARAMPSRVACGCTMTWAGIGRR